jgi:ribonucleoside-diphosphate reductase alpha chain
MTQALPKENSEEMTPPQAKPKTVSLRPTPSGKMGIVFRRHFSSSDCSPYDQFEWTTRDAVITNEKGVTVFEQKEVEVPASWSQMATNVVVSKYFRGKLGSSQRERSVRQLIARVADTITRWGRKDGYFTTDEHAQVFNDELTAILLGQYAAFNSPVWFNVGIEEKPQCSACFILSVQDTMSSLLDLQKAEGMLFKYGSGAGTNLSNIRSSKEGLSGGGIASGPVSFMRGYDAWAGTIKSGGKTRRAAKMQILNVDHPDIREFVDAKRVEEEKAWALIEQGYAAGFNVVGGAYDSVFFQNSNFSVRATDEFMIAALNGSNFPTRKRTDGSAFEQINAKELLHRIAENTWLCGDPGLQYDTTINDWHTCPASGRINASNPCSEYMHLDDSACNLASINLLKYLNADGSFDSDSLCHTVDILITAQDILIDNASYPTEKIGQCASNFRQLGLGFANLGAVLMSNGLPYDSDEGRALAGAFMAILCGEAYLMSTHMAERLGTFRRYEENRMGMLRVIDKHRAAAEKLPALLSLETLNETAREIWRAVMERGIEHGFRNSQTTVLAPTGTIAFLMDCDTTGIEPDIALVKYKKLVGGGGLKIVNQSVPQALTTLGYGAEEISEILQFINEQDTIEGAPGLKDEHLAVFDCAFKPLRGSRSINYLGHIKMMAAVQPFVSGAISKTVNMPEIVTPDDIFDAYVEAWRLGLKAIAIYRDNSKRSQPLETSKKEKRAKTGSEPEIKRRHLPDERQAITHKFNIAGHEGYITVGLYDDGSPGEIFLVMAKEGSTLSGVMDAFATSISLALQYGVPLSALVKKFSHMRFEPAGFTNNKVIPIAKSLLDYIFRWMALKFLTPEEQASIGVLPPSGETTLTQQQKVAGKAEAEAKNSDQAAVVSAKKNGTAQATADLVGFQLSEDAPPCTVCGSSLMVRQGSCYRCLTCGSQGGCG